MGDAIESWSYATAVTRPMGVRAFNDAMNVIGADGWELVTSVMTVKTWLNLTGNDLILIFKKRGAGHTPSREAEIALTGNDPEQAW